MNMQAKNYYKILGIDESANNSEIKRAYRDLAKKYHPDINQGDKRSEEKFKDVSVAYNVLSDSKKRQQYDQMRKFGGGGGGFDFRRGSNFKGFDFNDFGFGFGQSRGGTGTRGFSFKSGGGLGDLFSQIFNFETGTNTNRGQTPDTRNINVELKISLKLAVNGGKTTFSIEKEKICPVCNGGGAKPGSKVLSCPKCRGTGHVTISQGLFGISRPCPYCYGKGQIIKNPCNKCGGKGRINGKRSYVVNIPAGIKESEKIRLKGEGKLGDVNTPKGDMYVSIRIEPHDFFKREGNNIICEVFIKLKQAANGVLLKVKTIGEKSVRLKIPVMTKNGTRFRLKKMGIKSNGYIGDQYVTVRIKKPENPSETENELLAKLF